MGGGRLPKTFSKAGPKARPLLILASSSPRRRALLEEHGYRFVVIAPADVLEIAPAHLSPGETVLANARAKARAVAVLHPGAVVIGVDTEVFFEGRVLGKPADLRGALAMISRLNGRTHEVYSGVWIAAPSAKTKNNRESATPRITERGFIEVTRVHFHRRTPAQLRAYLERIQPLDKAGAYAAQNDHGEMIAKVEGSYSNVIGLPMETLARVLGKPGVKG